MAELAVSVLTSAGVSAGAASTIGTVLSVGLTAASAFSSFSAGNQQSESLLLQSQQASLNARAERLEGRRQSLAIQEQLDADLASQNAIFAARGVLQGEGSAEAAKEAATKNATRDIELARFNADVNAGNAETRAAIAESDAAAAKKKGVFDAVGTIGSYKSIPSFGSGSGAKKVPIPGRKPSLVG
ncbi:MAG: hypothetical protein ACPGQQ_00825 [Candidatus Puniceispirillaceae bacterium]